MTMTCAWACASSRPPSRKHCGCGGRGAINDGMSPAEAVRVFGVSPDSIHNWRRRQETEGTEGLRSGRPGRKTGERTKLIPAQE